jgi:polysaccharide deacetylase 2 family uncharacterized protein YibQ
MSDELNEPLGKHLPGRNTARPLVSRRAWAGAGLALMAAGAAGLALLPRDPYSGEPHAVARIEPAKPPAEPSAAETARAAGADDSSGGALVSRERVSTARELEQQSGVKITRSGGSEGPTARIIHIERAAGISLTPAPDRRVAEKGPHGLLPRIGAGGVKPMDVYARPFVPAPGLKADAPRIAIVVGGVGLNAGVTSSAIDELPQAVTLAFAPYGGNLDSLVSRARERGHEALLQAPMEPFDYPQNNPGPHTLLTAAQGGDGLDDLRWLMSRFSGYAGVMNYLGGRFTADEKALAPVLAEIAQRGLFFLDDGASPQSLTPSLAPSVSLPHARVDVAIDARGTPQSIDAALAQLEALARQKGSAIGFANALPSTITRIARFARDLERRGVALAPVSATLRAGAASAEAAGEPRR